MASQTQTPTLMAVTDDARQREQGEQFKARRIRLGMSRADLAKRAHVDRETLARVEDGRDGARDTTIAAIERTLADLEEGAGMDDPEQTGNVVRFVVRGVYGADALIVEGPVDNIAELEASVDRIMRRLRSGDDH